MSLITIQDVGLSYGSKIILNGINWTISGQDKVALVGNNRSGKSSLLKLIRGIIEPDGGNIITTRGVTIQYVSQEIIAPQGTIQDFIRNENSKIFQLIDEYAATPNQHIHDLLEAYQAFSWEKRYQELCLIFNFTPTTDSIDSLSGGQLKKLQLITHLIFHSDLSLLDEPTNHLDIEGIEALESIIQQSATAYIIVSHDRQFLDNVTNQFLEIWDGRTYLHQGDYAKYIESKAARLQNEQIEGWKMSQYLKRELKWVNAGVQARGVKDKGRLERYNELSNTAKKATNEVIELVIPQPEHLGTRIIDIENLLILRDGVAVLGPLNLKINKFDKIGIIGPNGSYKSTLISALLDKLPSIFSTQGTIKHGINTNILYFEQDKSSLNPDMSVIDYLANGKERLELPNNKSVSVYKYMSNWLFYKDQYSTPILNLSGGEKSKLLLAKKFLTPTNFLILDEPTNDLDLDTILLLENNLIEYSAPIILVSHDRGFLDHVCNIIISLHGPTPVISYGNYTDYTNKYAKASISINPSTLVNALITKPQDIRRKNANIRTLNKKVKELEAAISKIDKQLTDTTTYVDYALINELSQKRGQISEELDSVLEELYELEGQN
jgi:ABC transport system ATP-binding/permease protein